MASNCAYDTKSSDLYVPPLQELAQILQAGLTQYYKEVTVSVARPDAKIICDEWGASHAGFGGGVNGASTGVILDVGGVNNIHFVANHDKNHWTVQQLAKAVGMPDAFLFGAGASNGCCELIPNTSFVSQEHPVCHTHSAHVDLTTNTGYIRKHETDPSYRSLVNLYASAGEPCDMLSVHVKHALQNKQSLVSAMRTVLRQHYKLEEGKNVGLGGIFRVVRGAIKSHIMPHYPSGDLFTTEQVDNWLKFYQPIAAPLTCFSVQVAHDIPGWELRCEHTHFYGEKDGGHYHYDVTPEEIEYQGFFVPASKLFRIDQSLPPQ